MFVFSGVISFDNYLYSVINGVLGFIINILVFFVSHALFVEIRYAKKIKASWYKQVLYVLTFPVFMILYLPILFMALISKVEWEKIEHNVTKDIDEM